MDYFIVAAAISAVIVLVLSIALLRQPQRKNDAAVRPRPVEREGAPGRVAAVRNQRQRMRANAARHQPALAEEEPADVDAGEGEDAAAPARNIDFEDRMGAKKRAKLEAKAERKAAREAEEFQREERKKKDLQQEEERRKSEEREQEEEKKREEEERRAEEERQRREEAEYQELRAAFTVDQEGFEQPDEQRENLLQEFKDYIKAQKVVLLEDLAAHFKLKTRAAIERIASLRADGELTGVADERGKFIYITRAELERVACFIGQRGRVSIAELAESSNKLININPAAAP